MNEPIKTAWVKGIPKNPGYNKKLYDEGIGYYRLDHFPDNVYAFRRPETAPIPPYLEYCNDVETEKLERLRLERK